MDCEGHATCVLWSPFHGKPTHAQSIKSAKWRGSQHLGSTLSKDMTLNPAAVLHFSWIRLFTFPFKKWWIMLPEMPLTGCTETKLPSLQLLFLVVCVAQHLTIPQPLWSLDAMKHVRYSKHVVEACTVLETCCGRGIAKTKARMKNREKNDICTRRNLEERDDTKWARIKHDFSWHHDHFLFEVMIAVWSTDYATPSGATTVARFLCQGMRKDNALLSFLYPFAHKAMAASPPGFRMGNMFRFSRTVEALYRYNYKYGGCPKFSFPETAILSQRRKLF